MKRLEIIFPRFYRLFVLKTILLLKIYKLKFFNANFIFIFME